MRRFSRFPTAALLLLFAACSDSTTGLKPTLSSRARSNVITPSGTLDQNVTAILALLPKGLETAATTRWGNIKSKYAAGQIDPSQLAVAKQMLFELSDWVKQKAPNMDTPPDTETKPAAAARAVLYMSLYVYNGPTTPAPSYTPSADAVIGFVTPGAPATIVTPTTHAGVALEAGSVAENTIVVITQNPTPFPANCSGPLTTRLCQYPQFYTFEQFPHKRLLKDAKFAVCHINGGNDRRPLADHDRFRLAHSKPVDPADYTPGSTVRDGPGESIEILPLAAQTFTNCTDTEYAPEQPIGIIGVLDKAGRALASVLSPKPAFAIDQGGGGVSRFFSPFNDVDPLGSPDLAVQSISVSPPQAGSGGPLTLSFSVKNIGTATQSAVPATIILTSPPPVVIEGPPQPPVSQQIGSITLASLAPEASDTRTSSGLTIPTLLAPGIYTIKLVAGDNPASPDASALNNADSTTVSVIGVTDLGVLPGDIFSVADAINSSGHAVGASGTFTTQLPVLWSNGSMISLGTLGGPSGRAEAINDDDVVVGSAALETGGVRAFRWQNGTMTNLGTLPGGAGSFAVGINTEGKIVGYSILPGARKRGWIWQNGEMTDLGLLPGGTNTSPTGINDAGQVVGTGDSDSGQHGWVWQNGVMTMIGGASGPFDATHINSIGAIVGGGFGTAATAHAYLWIGGTLTSVGSLPGDAQSQATSISDDGRIVGSSFNGSTQHAFLWENGQILDIGGLGGTSAHALGINSHGQIVGQTNTAAGQSHATLWQMPQS